MDLLLTATVIAAASLGSAVVLPRLELRRNRPKAAAPRRVRRTS